MTAKRALFLAAVAAAVCLAPQAHAQEVLPPDWEDGVLGEAQPLLLTSAKLDLDSEGPAYQATTTLSFRNPRDAVIEGVAYIPIEAEAVERGFVVTNGGTTMRGQVRYRDRILPVYRRVTRQPQGKDPAVLERVSDHWLRATISPIAAHDVVVIKVSSVGLLDRVGTLRALHQPMPRTRGARGGWLPYDWSGRLQHQGATLLAPDQVISSLEPMDGGHSFQIEGPARHGGLASLYFSDPHGSPVSAYCHRSEDEDGYFLLEVDPSSLLAEPLEAARYVVVLDLPRTTGPSLRKAAVGSLSRELDRLTGRDEVAVLTAGAGEWVRPVAATPDALVAARWALRQRPVAHGSKLGTLLQKAADLTADSTLPVRVVLVTGRAFGQRAAALAAIRAQGRSGDFALFSLSLGEDLDRSFVETLVHHGEGRAFFARTAEHVAPVTGALVAAARRPTLRMPIVTLAGVTEVCADPPRVLTYGDTMTLSGRYPAGTEAIVRLRGQVGDALVDHAHGVELSDRCTSSPWVATWWASRRLRELEQNEAQFEPGALAFFETRLCERFGILGRTTAALALEPTLMAWMPRLVGPKPAGGGQALAAATVPLPPRPPEVDVPWTRAQRAITTAVGLQRGGNGVGNPMAPSVGARAYVPPTVPVVAPPVRGGLGGHR